MPSPAAQRFSPPFWRAKASSVFASPGAAIAASSVLVRVALLAVIFAWYHTSWSHYLSTSDAGSFVSVAHTLAGQASAGQLSLYDTRVFPGWPILLAVPFSLGLPEQTALLLVLGFAGLAPWLYARLKPETTAAWLFVACPPAWLLATVHPVSEAAYLCLALLGCLAVRADRWFGVGLAAGGLVLFRPFGLAWLAGFAGVLFLPSRPGTVRRALAFGIGGALVAAVFAAVNLHLYGDLLHQLKVYARPLTELNLAAPSDGASAGAGHWGWPFVHLLTTPWRYPTPLWKVAYAFGMVAVFLALSIAGLRRLQRDPALPRWEQAALLSLVFNTALSLCTGPYWGFHSVDRYLVWGLPGALVASEPSLRRWPALRPLLIGGGFIFAAFGLWNRFHSTA